MGPNTPGSSNRYDIGLALSGEVPRGFAHLGVLQFLEERGVHPEIVAGTSMGALMATLYCDGYRPQEIVELFCGRDFRKMTSLATSQRAVQYRRFSLFPPFSTQA